jgi:serine/threonine protein kinase, bacterial
VGTRTPPPRRWWRRKAIVIPTALLTVAVIAVAAVVITSQQHENSNGPQSMPTNGTQHREPAYGPQVTLPFTDYNNPDGVAVDTAGNLYVTAGSRVLKLPAG